jgi:class 3 adenylate cyclase
MESIRPPQFLETNFFHREPLVASSAAGHVLVADDHEHNREMVAQLLRQAGHRVTLAADGRSALEALASSDFDLVLLDIEMPEMNGFQVLEHLKEHPVWRHLPVVMISALDDVDSIVSCVEMGADDYLTKPFNPILLRARVQACLEKKGRRDQERQFLASLQYEQRQSEQLLLSILPKSLVDRLKGGERTIADGLPEASVLFADLSGFTRFSSRVPAPMLVGYLSEIFSVFDRLAQAHGVEKIKTVGDAYMAVGGLPGGYQDHARGVARLALAIQRAMPALNSKLGTNFRLRVGINIGPVVAGVIGSGKFSYDLWGDTVNVASRMQALCPLGMIQVTSGVRKLLRPQFRLKRRGLLYVKGRGLMSCYLLREELTASVCQERLKSGPPAADEEEE